MYPDKLLVPSLPVGELLEPVECCICTLDATMCWAKALVNSGNKAADAPDTFIPYDKFGIFTLLKAL